VSRMGRFCFRETPPARPDDSPCPEEVFPQTTSSTELSTEDPMTLAAVEGASTGLRCRSPSASWTVAITSTTKVRLFGNSRDDAAGSTKTIV
jgi:hypothetical protein